MNEDQATGVNPNYDPQAEIRMYKDLCVEYERGAKEMKQEIRDLKSFVVKLRGKTDPKMWRGIDDVTARAVLAEARADALQAEKEANQDQPKGGGR